MSLVELLLDRGADPGLRDTDGEPAHSPEGNQQEGIRVQIHFLSGLRILDDPKLVFFLQRIRSENRTNYEYFRVSLNIFLSATRLFIIK